MRPALHVTTRVLPGKRIEITAPDLNEGDAVEVILVLPERQRVQAPRDIMEFLDSLPPGPRSATTWGEVDRQLREEREAWDR